MPDDNSTPDGTSPDKTRSTAPSVSFKELASGCVLDEENDIEVWSGRHTVKYRRGQQEPMEFPEQSYVNDDGGIGVNVIVDADFEVREEIAEHLRKAYETMGYDPTIEIGVG